MEYHKCGSHPEHEFLLFFFRHWIDGCSTQAVVSADRAVKRQGCSFKQSSELVCPSSSDTNAYNSVSIYGSPRDAAPQLQVRYTPYSKLCSFDFPTSSAPRHFKCLLSCLWYTARPRHTNYMKTNAIGFRAQCGAA
ncbi:hypothetical protein BDR07DRAFT_1544585 [Suillus spraguei]|nr:hypothetical protein BDR07DRAFT_1544585 [Suillus spraguei]